MNGETPHYLDDTPFAPGNQQLPVVTKVARVGNLLKPRQTLPHLIGHTAVQLHLIVT